MAVNVEFDSWARQTDDDGGRIKYDGSDNLQFYTGGTEKVRISSSGSVGIGTPSPSQKLHVSGSVLANNYLLSPSAATIGTVSDTSIEMRTSADGTPAMIFRANGSSERMRISSAGTVGIGTGTPNASAKLHVSGGRSYFASNSNAFATYLRYNDSTAGVFVGSSAANEFRVSASSGALRLNIDAEGRLTSSGTGSGDIRIFKTSANSGTGLYINSQTTNQIDLVGYDGSAANAVNIRAGGATGSGLNVNTSNNVGIGTSAPSTILDVEGANINFASSENGILNVFSNDATAVDKGGSISLGGNSESGSLGFAMIKGAKQSTDAGYLAFGTRSAAANSTEHLRVDSGGKLNVNNTTGSARVNISADNWPENALALYSAGIAGQTNFAGMGFFNQDADSPIGQVADIYTNPTGTLSLTASGNPAIQLKYGSFGISGGTPALTVDNAGRVGIGTTTPSGAKLKVDGGATAGTIIQAGNAQGGVILGAESSTAYVNTTSATPLAFEINNSEKVRITSFGDVGIGRSDPQNIVGNHGGGLVVRSAAGRADTTGLFAVQDSSGNNMFSQTHNGQAIFSTGAVGSKVERMRIDSGGSVFVGGAGPIVYSKLLSQFNGTTNYGIVAKPILLMKHTLGLWLFAVHGTFKPVWPYWNNFTKRVIKRSIE